MDFIMIIKKQHSAAKLILKQQRNAMMTLTQTSISFKCITDSKLISIVKKLRPNNALFYKKISELNELFEIWEYKRVKFVAGSTPIFISLCSKCCCLLRVFSLSDLSDMSVIKREN